MGVDFEQLLIFIEEAEIYFEAHADDADAKALYERAGELLADAGHR